MHCVLNVHRASFSVDVLPVRSAEAGLFASSVPTQSKEAGPVLDLPHGNNNSSWETDVFGFNYSVANRGHSACLKHIKLSRADLNFRQNNGRSERVLSYVQ